MRCEFLNAGQCVVIFRHQRCDDLDCPCPQEKDHGALRVDEGKLMHPHSRACDDCYRESPEQYEAFPTVCPHQPWS